MILSARRRARAGLAALLLLSACTPGLKEFERPTALTRDYVGMGRGRWLRLREGKIIEVPGWLYRNTRTGAYVETPLPATEKQFDIVRRWGDPEVLELMGAAEVQALAEENEGRPE